jgi:hypothetical protein
MSQFTIPRRRLLFGSELELVIADPDLDSVAHDASGPAKW